MDGCVGCVNSQYHWRRRIPHPKECRRRIEKEMKNDPEQREHTQETKRKRRDFIERDTPGSSRSTSARRKNRTVSKWTLMEVEARCG